MKIVSAIFLSVAAMFLVGCSGSSEATTRQSQESEFKAAFGFPPPTTITAITYADKYSRGIVDGAYAQWLSFTFEQASFDKIIKGGYKEGKIGDIADGSGAPEWWPTTIPNGTIIFSRSQDDTPENEGFSFSEYIWHDKTSGLVFFHKSHCD